MNIEEQRMLGSIVRSGKPEDAIQKLKELDDLDILLDGRTALGCAVSYENDEVAKFLLENGANPNGCREEQFTPLMIAAERNAVVLLKLLLEKGADIAIKTPQGVNALAKAAYNENLEATKVLVEAGANPFEKIANGTSVYEGAEIVDATEIIEYFDGIRMNYE